MKRFRQQHWFSFVANIALATLVALPVYAVSTLGTNISTDGNMIVNSGSGKMGVGTTTPAQLFSVHGNALISGNVSSVANITATGTLAVTGAATLSSTLGVTGASTLTGLTSMVQASSTRLSVHDTAYFGGTATSSFTSAGVLTLQNGETISNSVNDTIALTAATTTLSGRGIFTTGYISQASSTVVGDLTVTGTFSPTASFQIGGGYGDTGTTLAATGDINTNGVLSLTGGTLNLGTGSATSTLTSASGLLGISSTTPSQLLSVQGNSYVSGTSYFGGAITATSTLTLSATSTHTYISNGLGAAGAPSYTFTGDLNNGMWSSAADTINFSTAGAERLRIDSSGRLGVGTTTPGTPLGVTGAGIFTGLLTSPNFDATSTTATSTLSTGGFAVGTNQFVVQQTSGNVGVATTSPTQLFSVQGNAYISGTSYFGGAITATSTLVLSATSTHTYVSNGLGSAGAPSYTFTGDLNNGMWSSAADTINFSTAGAERARIDSSGNLGIGTTTPGTPLGVTGAAVITGRVTSPSFEATSTTATTTLSTGGLAVGTNQFLVQQNSGNVGIGITNPNTKFEVVGTASTTNLIVGGNGTSLAGIVAGYCSFSDVTSFTASTTKYTDCTTTPTGALSTSHRVFVQATSSLQSMYVIQAASSTAASTINLRILNTGLDGAADTTLEGTSINFWAFK